VPIDLILHTPGGLVLASEQIARIIMNRESKVTVFIPHYAMSGGTLIALAADEIVMDENAVLGPIDPQLGEYPAASVLKVLDQKPIIYALMNLFPQPAQRRPSVQYIPVPYRGPEPSAPRRRIPPPT
jgi:ClpP class serine protease